MDNELLIAEKLGQAQARIMELEKERLAELEYKERMRVEVHRWIEDYYKAMDSIKDLERAVEDATRQEREACAKLALTRSVDAGIGAVAACDQVGRIIAAAIRARGAGK